MLLPTLLSLPPAPLPTTLIAEVIDASGARVVGAVDAPMWLMPLAAAGCGLIPVSLLALSKGAAPPAGAVASASAAVQGARDRVQGARDRVFSIANKYPKLRRRLRRSADRGLNTRRADQAFIICYSRPGAASRQ